MATSGWLSTAPPLSHSSASAILTARAVSPSVNPRQRRGTSADADAPQTRQGQPSVQKNPPAEAGGFKSISVVWII